MHAIPYGGHVATWLALVVITGWCWIGSARRTGWDPRLDGVTLLEDRVYREGGARQATLDVYLPAAGAPAPLGLPRPAVLAIHGGSWTGGSKRLMGSGAASTIRRMVQAGLAVIAIDYRLARPGAPSWPLILDDLREAVRWTRRQAQELGIDPDRIVAYGQSSGALLAALLATHRDPGDREETSSRVQAVISFYGPSDLDVLVETRRLAHDPSRLFLGGQPADLGRLSAAASPLASVSPVTPPMLLAHGTDDRWVPIEQSMRLAETLQQNGVMHRLIVVDGARHGFEASVIEPAERDLLPEIFAFLKSVWNLQ
jgi:acetyl esterase/lipase